MLVHCLSAPITGKTTVYVYAILRGLSYLESTALLTNRYEDATALWLGNKKIPFTGNYSFSSVASSTTRVKMEFTVPAAPGGESLASPMRLTLIGNQTFDSNGHTPQEVIVGHALASCFLSLHTFFLLQMSGLFYVSVYLYWASILWPPLSFYRPLKTKIGFMRFTFFVFAANFSSSKSHNFRFVVGFVNSSLFSVPKRFLHLFKAHSYRSARKFVVFFVNIFLYNWRREEIEKHRWNRNTISKRPQVRLRWMLRWRNNSGITSIKKSIKKSGD